MIDAHTHLYSNQYNSDLKEVIERAGKRLTAVIISAVDFESLGKSLEIRRQYQDFIYVTAGIHPRKTAEMSMEKLKQLLKNIDRIQSEIVALGEVGPDFYHIHDPRQQQRQLQVLDEVLFHAEKRGLPLVVHARQAESAALELLSRSRIPVMFHCFTGSKQIARKITSHGFYISFSAILLAHPELQEAATAIPAELILTETDSPALSPLPGQSRNEPVLVEKVVTCLARLLKCTAEQISDITDKNARKFYGLPSQPEI